MSERKLYVGLLVVAVALLVVVWAAPPDKITIEKCGEKKASVEFNHAAHVAAADKCSACHHTQEDLTADAGEAKKCRDCHLEAQGDKIGACSEMSPSKNPYHKQCVGCHKSVTKTDKSIKAPTKCDDCHPKG
jgi:hypothetical protein